MIRFYILPLTVVSLLLNCNLAAQTETKPISPARPNPAALFSGDRAMADLVKQVEFGPRLPGSPGIKATRQLIEETLTENGWSVHRQDFQATSPLLGRVVDGQNIFGVYPKGADVKYIVSAHYDTRPYADMDPNPAKRQDPVPGANDGASGVAVLLELARVIPQLSPKHGIGLVFFDLEDHGASGDRGGFCLGSRYMAQHLPSQLKNFQYGINLDMVADKDLKLRMEGYSLSKAPKLTFDLWRTGNALFPDVWVKERGRSIYDDHMPFLGAGHEYINVIDFDYQPWHTINDTPNQCSSHSIDIVGDTISIFIFR